MASEPVSIFFSYSRKDAALRQDLDDHLAPLKRSGLIASWYDGCIGAGEEWETQIKQNLEKAQIILLLISVDFIKSDFCYNVELTKAIERHKAGNACVIPVLMRSCLWKTIPIGDMLLGDLQALPKDAKPISKWVDRDDAFTSIAEGLLEKIQQVQQEGETEVQQQQIAAERRRQSDDCYNSGVYHLNQGNFDQAVTDLTWAERLGHLEAPRLLSTIKSCKHEQTNIRNSRGTWLGMLHNATSSLMFQAEQKLQELYEYDLRSEKDVDYTRLRDLLKAGDWEAADEETEKVMLQAAAKKPNQWFTDDALSNFPCTDLQTIDRLWVKYSRGQFGFSVQKQIYVECGAKLDGKYPGVKIWNKFGNKVGWRVKKKGWIYWCDVTFNTSAPRGHLPVRVAGREGNREVASGWAGRAKLVRILFSRIETCNF
jgi:tetratricopeptide (TPR) repeat protein